MTINITIKGKRAKKGERMMGSGWHLATTKGRKRVFRAKLLSTHNLGTKRISIGFRF